MEVLERSSRRGSREAVIGHAQTKADGSFSYVLSKHRPTQKVRFAYRARSGGIEPVWSRALTLKVAEFLKAALGDPNSATA